MNIIQANQERRKNQIAEIKFSITRAIKEKTIFTFKDLVMATSSNLGISKRTAKEYVEMALFQLKMRKEDLGK